MKNLIKLTLLGLILSTCQLHAQQQEYYAQYMFNHLLINPAYSGYNGYSRASFSVRQQWSGIQGAPSSKTFTVDAPLNTTRKLGIGAIMATDEIGISSRTSALVSSAIRVRIDEKSTLAFGLQGGVSSYRFSESSLGNINPDPILGNDINITRANFGAGLFYSSERFFTGVSIPQIIKSNFSQIKDTENVGRRQVFFNTGYIFTINHQLKFKPSFLVSYIESNPLQFDANMSVFIRELLWFGLSYRSFDAFNVLVNARVVDRLEVGYAYEFATQSEISSVFGNTHEFLVTIKLFNKKSYASPRYF